MFALRKFKLAVLFRNMLPDAVKLYQQNFQVEHLENDANRRSVLDRVAGKDAILCTPFNTIDRALLDAAGSTLKAIATISAGYEHIDVDECKRRNIRVGYLGALVSEATAEFTVGLMIATAHRFREAGKQVESGQWEKFWEPILNMLGKEIRGSTVGIVGFGNIGQRVAKRLQPFQVANILYCGPTSKAEGELLGAQYVTFRDLLKRADFVVACCSSNNQTQGMFNEEAFRQMKPESIFINVGRGNLVNHDHLYDALASKRIWAAGLDTISPEPFPHTHRLVKLNNCLILPHIATSVEKLKMEAFVMTHDNLLAGVRGQPMPTPLC